EAIDDLLVDTFLEAQAEAPEEIVLDVDTTDFAIHGQQEGRFYHGYYDQYCYLPLYVFAGEHVLCARLRQSNIDPSAGSVNELERIIRRIRARWPEVKDRKSTRLNSSHRTISYAVFCLKKKTQKEKQ